MKWYDLTDLLPPVYKAVIALAKLTDSENTTFKQILDKFQAIKENFFIQTCDEVTLKEWEYMLAINVSPLDSMEYRRKRVIAYLHNETPFTYNYWQRTLDELVGVGKWELRVESGRSILLNLTDDVTELRIGQMAEWAMRVKPAHMEFLAGWKYYAEQDIITPYYGLAGVTVSCDCIVPPPRFHNGFVFESTTNTLYDADYDDTAEVVEVVD